MGRIINAGLVSPLVSGVAGGLGVWGARSHVDLAPEVVFVAMAVMVAATVVRERGIAFGALGVGVAAAFPSPAGLGPLLVATGVIVACQPAAIDRRLARWPDLVDALVALPALAGLASVAAAQPSDRGLVVAGTAGALAVVSWWRGPRHGVHEPARERAVAYVGAVFGVLLVLAPELFDVLGALPDATRAAGHSLAGAVAVFAIALLVQEVRLRNA